MARLARLVAPGVPHHVTARGNRREPIFFEDGDQEVYLELRTGPRTSDRPTAPGRKPAERADDQLALL